MSAAKELFLKDAELRSQLITVTKADWFQKALAFAKADMLDTPHLNEDMLQGARLFETTLLNLPEVEPQITELVSSGISHEPPPIASRQPKTKTTI